MARHDVSRQQNEKGGQMNLTATRCAQILARAATGVLALGVFFVLTSSSGDAAPRKARKAIIAPKNSIFWGAAIGTQFTGTEPPWDMAAVDDLEKVTHKTPSIVHFYGYWGDCDGMTCSNWPFPRRQMTAIRHNGQIPMLSWGSAASNEVASSDASYSLSNIVNGSLDGYIRSFATSAKRWGHPFFLRFDWEMNGNWFPWGDTTNNNSPAEEVAAWRHVYDIFDSVGAKNVTWVWCPNIEGRSGARDLSSIYPGNAYVNWTCLDGYTWGTTGTGLATGGWKSFTQLYASSYDELKRLAPHKPVMVGEFASTATGGSKSAWIRNALSVIPARFHNIRAISYFDEYASGMDWPLETSPAVEQAFASGIADPAFTGAAPRELPARLISPP
jgi:mannan endo-1,4-beta-mannosidase